jgi:hypothetical protein
MKILKISKCSECPYIYNRGGYKPLKCTNSHINTHKYMSTVIEGEEIPIFCPLEEMPKETDKELE